MPDPKGRTLLINPIANPLQLGLYDGEGHRIRSWEEEGYVSDRLVETLNRLLDEERIERILYANGPGSYMGIKLAYITLRTLEMSRGIPFAAVSAFSLNGGQPLKAMGKLYFVKEKETIITRKYEERIPQSFGMPECLDSLEIQEERTPDYRIPAV